MHENAHFSATFVTSELLVRYAAVALASPAFF